MSLVDRLNRRLIARLRRDTPYLLVEDEAIRSVVPNGAERRLLFAELARATVLVRDVYAADAILLRLEWPDARLVVFEDDPQWSALVAALDRTGDLTTHSRMWQVQAIADGPDAPPRELL